MENHKIDEIIALLEQYPLCAKIVAYFLENRHAMDTVRGIAEWWIQEDLDATQVALHHLVEQGIVVVRFYIGTNFYSFTPDPKLQAKLEDLLRESGSRD
ncbi:MAG: hypothetical protein D6736_10235 [Nitrospinota bacterium]|nr:MAG: hypothetical protein D6736_10235 [Nitrospinota bacterium]